MDSRARRRWAILLCLVCATAFASFYPAGNARLAEPARTRLPQPATAAVTGTPEVDGAAPVDDAEETDPFAPRGWQAPPPPPELAKPASAAVVPSVPAAPPGPPPLPYKFMGRMNSDGASSSGDGSAQTVYLSKGDQIVIVQGGETLDGTYKVLSIEAERIEFEHVPTGEKQVLTIPAPDK